MPSILGATYPVSAIAQSQQPQPPARAASAAPLAQRAEAVTAAVSGERSLVSNRVHAYLSTERANQPRSERDSAEDESHNGEAEDDGGIDLDEAETYRPGSLY